MKQLNYLPFQKYYGFFLVMAFVFIIFACKNKKTETVMESKNPSTDSTSTQEGPAVKLEEYKIVLASDKIKIKSNENLTVSIWIGDKSISPFDEENIKQDSNTFPARLGQYAKIEPYAPDFNISSPDYGCIRIDKSGSVIQYTLSPKKTKGTYRISAIVKLYEGEDCIGTPVPKTSRTLTITVELNLWDQILFKLEELGSIFWDKLLSFWGALLTFLFGIIFLLVKRKFSKDKS